MILIRKLIWDLWNIKHIARHNIHPDEIEEACHSDPLVLRGQQKNRLVLIGKIGEDKIITVVLEPKKNHTYYPITAYSSDTKERSLYKRLKGGVN